MIMRLLGFAIICTMVCSMIHIIKELLSGEKYVKLFWIKMDIPAHYLAIIWPFVVFWNLPKKLFIYCNMLCCGQRLPPRPTNITPLRILSYILIALLSAIRIVYLELLWELLQQPWGYDKFLIPDFRSLIIKFFNRKNGGLIGLYWNISCHKQIVVYRI